MTDKIGSMFECLHRALEDKNVDKNVSPRPSAQQPGALQPKQAVV